MEFHLREKKLNIGKTKKALILNLNTKMAKKEEKSILLNVKYIQRNHY
jgi:hypothetical protein